jgi:hypothetical protein
MRKEMPKISYEPGADVLMLEKNSNEPIEYAEEVGNFIVHFGKKHNPILVEILEASKFLTKAGKLMLSKNHTRIKMA